MGQTGVRSATFAAISAIDVAQPPSIVSGYPCPRALRARSWGGRTNSHHRTSHLDIALRLTSG
jgi:hypothetical protein